jgi:TRAP-type C4-dicarboxylate transport system substrate-binding protein
MIFGIGSAIAAGIDNYSGPSKEIRLSVHVPSTHLIWKKMLQPWADTVKSESQGKLVIKPYLGGVLHSARDGFKAVRGNVTDLAMCYPAWSPAGFHLNHVFGLPFAFPSASVAALAAEELYPKYLKQEYEKKDIYLAFYSSMATYDLVSTKPVRKLEDLKGMKVRTVAGPMADAAKLLGAVPVFMSINEVYTALQRGMIDAVLTPNFAGYAYRFFEIAKYVTRLDFAVTASAWGHNPKTFKALPEPLKTPWYNLLRQGSQYWANAMDEQNRLSRERNKKEGIEVITLSPDEYARWKKALQPLWDQFVEKNEAKGLPAKELVRDLQEKSKKYSTWTPAKIKGHVIKQPVKGIITY